MTENILQPIFDLLAERQKADARIKAIDAQLFALRKELGKLPLSVAEEPNPRRKRGRPAKIATDCSVADGALSGGKIYGVKARFIENVLPDIPEAMADEMALKSVNHATEHKVLAVDDDLLEIPSGLDRRGDNGPDAA